MRTPDSQPPNDWRDRLARGDVPPATLAAWRAAWSADDEARDDLEGELALNRMLDATAAPKAASNLTARIIDAARRETVAPAGTRLPRWLPWRGLAFASLLATATLGAWRWQAGMPGRQARAAAEVIGMASAGGIPAAALADFEAVRRLDAAARPEDEALVIALLQ